MKTIDIGFLSGLTVTFSNGIALDQGLELYENMTAIGSQPCIMDVGDGPIQISSARLNKREDLGCNFVPAVNVKQQLVLLPKSQGAVGQSTINLDVGSDMLSCVFVR